MITLEPKICYTDSDWSGGTSVLTPVEVNYGDAATALLFKITKSNIECTISKPSEDGGDIDITYTLTSHESFLGSITPQYSYNNSTWNTATSAGGDDGLTSLVASTGGTSHTFIWDTTTDLGLEYTGTIYFRILTHAISGIYTKFMPSENTLTLTIDNAPDAPTLISPAANYFSDNETTQFIITIPDPKYGDNEMHFKIEVDTESSFDTVNLVRFESYLDQEGWEYDSTGAGAWVNIPRAGINSSGLTGNQVRYTLPTELRLSVGEKYWRAFAAGVVT